MTALDYADANNAVILFYAGVGCPAGRNIALLDGVEPPFDLSEIEGEIGKYGFFEATNLSDGFSDGSSNTVYKIQLYSDKEEYDRQREEYDSYA